MKVSIIIPVYNVAPYVKECIQSIMNQTYTDLEVLIVDDCSTDNTLEIVSSMLFNKEEVNINGSIFKIIRHKNNKGVSETRNTGLKQATGDFIFFLDGDDTITDNCIEVLIKKAIATGSDIVESRVNSYHIPNKGLIAGSWSSTDQVRKVFFDRQIHPESWGRIVRRQIISDHNLSFYKNVILEDVLWGLEVICNAHSLCIVNDKLYNYRARPDSLMSNQCFNARLSSVKTILQQCLKVAEVHHIDKDPNFINWLEFYKAKFFADIKTFGTSEQLKTFYCDSIRKIHPVPQLNKDNIHYLFPSFIGFYVYQRFYGRRFC